VGVELRVEPLDPREVLLHELDRRHLPLAYEPRLLERGEEGRRHRASVLGRYRGTGRVADDAASPPPCPCRGSMRPAAAPLPPFAAGLLSARFAARPARPDGSRGRG